MSKTAEERETILRWDERAKVLHIWTASPRQARRLIRRGYLLEEWNGGWRGSAPLKAVTFRTLGPGGALRKRQSGGFTSKTAD
jgi:hypothetical protein